MKGNFQVIKYDLSAVVEDFSINLFDIKIMVYQICLKSVFSKISQIYVWLTIKTINFKYIPDFKSFNMLLKLIK